MSLFKTVTTLFPTQVIEIWKSVKRILSVGGLYTSVPTASYLAIDPCEGQLIPGAPILYELTAGGDYNLTVMPLWYVIDAVDASATTVKVIAVNPFSELTATTKVMGVPATLAATGKGVTTGTITALTGADVGGYSFSITANGLGALAAGSYLTTAVAATASTTMVVQANSLLLKQENFTADTFAGSSSVVVSGEIWIDRNRAIPQAVLAGLPMITPIKEGGVING